MRFEIIGLSKIVVGENFSRDDIGNIDSLVASIRDHGLHQPIIVDANYNLIAGFRRFHAVSRLGWDKVHVSVSDTDNPGIVNLVENLERCDLTFYQECIAIQRVFPGCGEVEVAETVGRSRSWATLRVRFWELPQEVQDLVKNGELTASRVKLILHSKNQLEACEKVLGKTRNEAASLLGQKPAKKEVQEVITHCLERGLMDAVHALRFTLGDINQEEFWEQVDK